MVVYLNNLGMVIKKYILKKERINLFWIKCLFCFFLLISITNGETIRVGVNRDEVYLYAQDSENEKSWFIEELINWGKENNYKPEFIIKEWSELEEDFKEKRIDALFPTNITSEREKSMDFSRVLKKDPFSIISRSDNKIVSLEELAGQKVGTIHSSLLIENLSPIIPEITYFHSSGEAVKSLEAGAVDYLILNRGSFYLHAKSFYVVGDLWIENEGRIALQKNKEKIVDSLNGYFFNNKDTVKKEISEKIFMEEARTIRYKLNDLLKIKEKIILDVVVPKAGAPFVKVENGELISSSIDIIKLFNKLSPNIKLRVIPPSEQLEFNEELKRLERGEVDIMIPVGLSSNRDKLFKRVDDNTFNYDDSAVLLGHKLSGNISSLYEAKGGVGSVRNTFLERIILKNIPLNQKKVFSTREDALDALNKKEIDYLLDTNQIIDNYLSLKEYKNIKKLFNLDEIIYGIYFAPTTSEVVLGDIQTIMNSVNNNWHYDKPEGRKVTPSFVSKYLSQIKVLLILILCSFIFYQKRYLKEKATNEKILKALIGSLENVNYVNNEETGEHIVRIGMYSEVLAKALMLSKPLVKDIKTFASLHDLGKVAVPKEILEKPGKLTVEEFEEIKEHTTKGGEITQNLSGISFKKDLPQNIVLYHHEKWDGSGYPKGLKGSEIPIEARIVALSDVYDALRMPRTYKEAFSHEKAYSIILEGAGKHFDPKLVEIFIKSHQKFNTIYLQNS